MFLWKWFYSSWLDSFDYIKLVNFWDHLKISTILNNLLILNLFLFGQLEVTLRVVAFEIWTETRGKRTIFAIFYVLLWPFQPCHCTIVKGIQNLLNLENILKYLILSCTIKVHISQFYTIKVHISQFYTIKVTKFMIIVSHSQPCHRYHKL